MNIRVGINGFGRIGRNTARIIATRGDIELVAINSGSDAASHAYLLAHDSVQKDISQKISTDTSGNLLIDGKQVRVFMEKDPAKISWATANVDVVLECTGKFRTKDTAGQHLRDSVSRVVVSAPAKDDMPTYIMGVNHASYAGEAVVSNSSCTTNCVATTLKPLDEALGVLRGSMTTVHAVTDSQNLLDNSHAKSIRLRRNSLVNIIPTTSGSATDVAKLFPHLKGKLPCRSLRVPVADASLIELVVEVGKPTSVDAVNALFSAAAAGPMKGILSVATEELVSSDYIGNSHSAIVDPFLTDVVGETLVHVTAWYDNEWGYANRLVDMATHILPATHYGTSHA